MPLTHTSALLTISTSNFDRLVVFYQHLLDQQPIAFIPSIYAEFDLPGVKLGIFRCTHSSSSPSPHPPIPSSPSGMALCLEVQNLESAIAHLTQLGSPLENIMTASHGREVYTCDPDGNWLILHQSHAQA